MTTREKDILVLLRPCRDPKVPADPKRSGYGIRERGARYLTNPSDMAAFAFALGLKKTPGATVTVVGYGPDHAEEILNDALIAGADRAILLNLHSFMAGDTMVEAKILARLIEILAPVLVCTGSRLLDGGATMALPLAAAHLGWCAVHSVVEARLEQDRVEVVRKSDRGARQRVRIALPGVFLFEETEVALYPDLDRLLEVEKNEVERWALTQLGLSFTSSLNGGKYTRNGGTGPSRPRPLAVATPDPDLPAFERILSLLEGGIPARQGKLDVLGPGETAQRILGAAASWDKQEEAV